MSPASQGHQGAVECDCAMHSGIHSLVPQIHGPCLANTMPGDSGAEAALTPCSSWSDVRQAGRAQSRLENSVKDTRSVLGPGAPESGGQFTW